MPSCVNGLYPSHRTVMTNFSFLKISASKCFLKMFHRSALSGLGPRQFGHTPQKKKRKSAWKLQVDKSKSKYGAISLSLTRDLSSFSTLAPPKCRSLLRFLLLISIFQQRSTKKKKKGKKNGLRKISGGLFSLL